MNKPKHTPGPWGWFRGYLVTTNKDGSVPLNSKIICSEPNEILDNKANARLIAAAPEMLEALLKFEAAWREFARENPGVNMGAFTQALCVSKDAIAKATGGGE